MKRQPHSATTLKKWRGEESPSVLRRRGCQAATRNEESERVVDPYFLDIYRGSNPYLIGFCHKRQAIRDFRIDRIKNLRILDETFEKDSSFNAKAYLEKRFQNEGGDKLFSVTI